MISIFKPYYNCLLLENNFEELEDVGTYVTYGLMNVFFLEIKGTCVTFVFFRKSSYNL